MAGENFDNGGDGDLDKAVDQLDEELARRLSKQSKQSENVYTDPRQKFKKQHGSILGDLGGGDDDATVISITLDAESLVEEKFDEQNFWVFREMREQHVLQPCNSC